MWGYGQTAVRLRSVEALNTQRDPTSTYCFTSTFISLANPASASSFASTCVSISNTFIWYLHVYLFLSVYIYRYRSYIYGNLPMCPPFFRPLLCILVPMQQPCVPYPLQLNTMKKQRFCSLPTKSIVNNNNLFNGFIVFSANFQIHSAFCTRNWTHCGNTMFVAIQSPETFYKSMRWHSSPQKHCQQHSVQWLPGNLRLPSHIFPGKEWTHWADYSCTVFSAPQNPKTL